MSEAIELYFSSTGEGQEDKIGDDPVIWKDILREGKFAVTPGRRTKKPFTVVATGTSDAEKGIISMSDLHAGFDAKAFEDVTIPDGHPKPGESQLNNTGYVRALRTVKKKGKHFLQAALGFTEPDVAGKVKRGSVPNVSSGIFFDFTRKADDTHFPCVLNHVALTKQPWINDLEPFKKVFASDGIDEDEVGEIESCEFEDDDKETDSGKKGEIVWNAKSGANFIRQALERALRPEEPKDDDGRPYMPKPWYYVEDVDTGARKALAVENYKGASTNFIIPYTVDDDDGVVPAPSTRWVEAQPAMIAAADEDVPVINFDDMSVANVMEQLSLSLNDMFGDDVNFAVNSVTMDSRAKLHDEKNDKWWIAQFAIVGDGKKAVISPTEQWEPINAPEADAASGRESAPQSESKEVTLSDDQFDLTTPEGRVEAARAKRRAMLGQSTK